jgi:hypothetical protein
MTIWHGDLSFEMTYGKNRKNSFNYLLRGGIMHDHYLNANFIFSTFSFITE